MDSIPRRYCHFLFRLLLTGVQPWQWEFLVNVGFNMFQLAKFFGNMDSPSGEASHGRRADGAIGEVPRRLRGESMDYNDIQ